MFIEENFPDSVQRWLTQPDPSSKKFLDLTQVNQTQIWFKQTNMIPIQTNKPKEGVVTDYNTNKHKWDTNEQTYSL